MPAAVSEKEKSLRATVEREPRSFDANHLLGKALIEDGKAREAIPYLERARELKPGDYENSYDLAVANENAGNYERARDQAQASGVNATQRNFIICSRCRRRSWEILLRRSASTSALLNWIPAKPYVFDWGSELLLHHARNPRWKSFARASAYFLASIRMLIGQGASLFARGSYDEAEQRIMCSLRPESERFDSVLVPGKNARRGVRTFTRKVVEKLHRFVTQQPESASSQLLLCGRSLEASDRAAGYGYRNRKSRRF